MTEHLGEDLWVRALKDLEDGALTHDRLRSQLGITARQLKRRLTAARAVRLHSLPEADRPSGIELYLGPNQLGPTATPETCQHPKRAAKGEAFYCLDCGFEGLSHLADFRPAPPLPEDPKPRGYGDEPGGGTGPRMSRWAFKLPKAPLIQVQASSEAEARVAAKRKLEMGKKARFPAGTVIRRLT